MQNHINAPIMNSNGPRWSQCAKCRRVFGLSAGFSEGSHLVCPCGQNLLLKNMTNAEHIELLKQFTQEFTSLGQEIEKLGLPPIGSKFGNFETRQDTASNEIVKYFEQIESIQRNALSKLNQRAVRQFVAKAAYRLGQISKRMQQKDPSNSIARNKEIKSELARVLCACGVAQSEIEIIISDLVEVIRNV